MFRANTADMQLLTHCISQLFSIFTQKSDVHTNLANNTEQYKFRVPVKLPVTAHGKKFYMLTKAGKINLSRREVECIQCLVNGLSAKETGEILFLSSRTVETYLISIKNKMNCRNKREIISLLYF